MFVYPPLPPKDYELKRVVPNALSNVEFTQSANLRVTVPEIAEHVVPVYVTKADPPTRAEYKELTQSAVSNWVNKERGYWVPKPGVEDYFIHDMYKKYNVVVDDNYDPRYKHRSPIFVRSFKYELDCLEAYRRKRLQQKMIREAKEDVERWNKAGKCNIPMPDGDTDVKMVDERWQEVPVLFAPSQSDPCLRRSEFAMIGQSFKHEACNWYYKHYPPPDVPWRPEKFSK